jgi:hypothetical protein
MPQNRADAFNDSPCSDDLAVANHSPSHAHAAEHRFEPEVNHHSNGRGKGKIAPGHALRMKAPHTQSDDVLRAPCAAWRRRTRGAG